MYSNQYLAANEIRLQFTQAMSEMYQLEVPLYKRLLELADKVNQEFIEDSISLSQNDNKLLSLEHHGAIRVGHASELSMVRRLFDVMGMQPVDYYDLSVAGIPVHSTAFRAVHENDLQESPFRVFCSLLRLDLIDEKQLREQASKILNKRHIFPDELLMLIELSEKQDGLSSDQADSFIKSALEVFRWHKDATVNKRTYDNLKTSHGLITDIVSFKGPHINHLTPKVLDIDAFQSLFKVNDIKAKSIVEGPPKRDCPILLRQTSFIAIAEDIIFSDGQVGTHTARFGEVEQRGIALTPKGREIYDRLLNQARNDKEEVEYSIKLKKAFKEFPDTYTEIRQQGLGYFHYAPKISANNSQRTLVDKSNDIETLISKGLINASPVTYQDFLPVSAAGIFTSNLSSETQQAPDTIKASLVKEGSNKKHFESALGAKVIDSFDLYEALQQDSINNSLKELGLH
ncbi:MAG: putative glyoxalase superfamily metalloenzyme YdcJ [Cocleimonas sp.]|jgi:uncharacterized glyoxalase superfamily metalloenzyme YdcJ